MRPLRNKSRGSIDEDLGGVPCNDAMGLSLSGSGSGGNLTHDVSDKVASAFEVNGEDVAPSGAGCWFVVVIPEFHSRLIGRLVSLM